MKTIEM